MSSGLFNFFRGRKEPASRDVAKQRLQLVLVHDRSNISPGLLEALKGEIIDVISKRVEIDGAATQISFTQTRTEIKLVADIPLVDGRRRKPRERTGGQ